MGAGSKPALPAEKTVESPQSLFAILRGAHIADTINYEPPNCTGIVTPSNDPFCASKVADEQSPRTRARRNR